jgi:hypothetical protein
VTRHRLEERWLNSIAENLNDAQQYGGEAPTPKQIDAYARTRFVEVFRRAHAMKLYGPSYQHNPKYSSVPFTD